MAAAGAAGRLMYRGLPGPAALHHATGRRRYTLRDATESWRTTAADGMVAAARQRRDGWTRMALFPLILYGRRTRTVQVGEKKKKKEERKITGRAKTYLKTKETERKEQNERKEEKERRENRKKTEG